MVRGPLCPLMNMVMNILIRVPTPATTHQPEHITKGTKVEDHKREKTENNQKRLLGLYKLPSESEWNEAMTEDEKRAFIDSMIKNMVGNLEENPNE